MLAALAFVFASSRPTLDLPLPASHERAFAKAEENLLDINTLPYDPKRFDQSGLLQGRPGKFIRAGGDYQEPWTRDAAINSWNAASLLEPEIARNTLFAVLGRDEAGRPVVQRDNQWWDKVVWIVGAWNHYLVTGDRDFLRASYGVATRLLKAMRAERFDAEYGLFQGPSFFNDGIAGYPAPPAPADDAGSTFVLDHPGTDKILALSTNCLYVGAYRTAALMAHELGRPKAEADADLRMAQALRRTIDRRFWMPDRGLYGYFIHGTGALRGRLDPTQEGSGLAFAILFDVAPRDRAASILSHAHLQPFGITDTYPNFARYSDSHPGRHNVLVWPMVQGLWARAAAKAGNVQALGREMDRLERLALGSGGDFYEIYDSRKGTPEGGWQSGIHFNSVSNQTWSATAYLSMVLNGVFGLRFEPDGLRFEPLVPAGWNGATLRGIRYRNAVLDVRLAGEGARLRSVRLDGKPLQGGRIPPDLTGSHLVELRR